MLLNFESKSRYNVVVEATDGQGGSVTQIMYVSLVDDYESPILPNSRRSVVENSLRGTMVGVPIIASSESESSVLDNSSSSVDESEDALIFVKSEYSKFLKWSIHFCVDLVPTDCAIFCQSLLLFCW